MLPATADPFGDKFWQALADDTGPAAAIAPPTVPASMYGTPAPGYAQPPPEDAGWRREKKLSDADADAIDRERKQRDEEIQRRLQSGRGGGGPAYASTFPGGGGGGGGMPPGGGGFPGGQMYGAPPGYGHAVQPQEISVRQEREAAAGLMLTRPLGTAPPPPVAGLRF